MIEIQEGDVVNLKSGGGFPMTVGRLKPFGWAECFWWHEDVNSFVKGNEYIETRLRQRDIRTVALVKVSDEVPI